ncbi:MAG: MerR family transcriptional regulator [Beutenbergiaceae bacterium]
MSVPSVAASADDRWPSGVSRTPTMSIGSALGVLQQEFPTVTISKVRFLEEQGIVSPHRTPSGYRTYSQADIERLRFALAAQRDSYLPWAKIRERLDVLDAGTAGVPAPGARVVTEDGELTGSVGRRRLSAAQLADETDTEPAVIEELTDVGLLVIDPGGKYPSQAIDVVRAANNLAEHGVHTRHLRAIRTAAERQLDILDAIVAPVRSHRSGPRSAAAAARAHTLACEVADSFSTLHSALLRAGVDRLQ